MQLDYDYIICGGGISGLLLSTKLSQDPNQSKKSILLIDPVFPKTENDRTLCFWDNKNTIWDEIIKSKSEVFAYSPLRPCQYLGHDQFPLMTCTFACFA